jgi:hypothetical protein
MNGKALQFICSGSTAVLKEYNIARHYNSKHKEKYENCVGALRREKVAALKRGHESQQNVFRKQSNDSSSALRASYHVAHLLAIERKPLSDGELVRKYLQHITQKICPEKRNCF